MADGPWHAWLDSPGGELPFELQLQRIDDGWTGVITNGDERTVVRDIEWNGTALTLNFAVYDAGIRAVPSEGGRRLDGEAWRRLGRNRWGRLPFHATAGRSARFEANGTIVGGRPEDVDGRWTVQFEKREHPSVAMFHTTAEGEVRGTFLNTSGDYRYLAGSFNGERLLLSRYDGSNTFLFDARFGVDGTLTGRFWEGDYHEDGWTARRDPDAMIPDSFEDQSWSGPLDLESLSFHDTNGRSRSLADSDLSGGALVIEIMGTWCPNCQDASACLEDLYKRYRDDGLSVVGLAFELTGELERDMNQLRLYAEAHSVSYPLLLASTESIASPSEVFPQIEGEFAFPTVIFARGDGEIRTIHTGFSGPATGKDHVELRARFEEVVREMLSDPPRHP